MSEKAKVIIIKKKGKGHGHHGGAWKVAYADFVTAMMALFIVLWLLTQSDQASKAEIAQYFRTGKLPGGSLVLGGRAGSNPPMAVDLGFDGAPPSGMAQTQKRDVANLAKKVKEMLDRAKKDSAVAKVAKNVAVKAGETGAVIDLVDGGENLMFPLASTDLQPAAQAFLKQLAPMIAEGQFEIEIHGHTDARPYGQGSKRSNWDLSFERADSARRAFESAGVPAGKIQAVVGHADAQLYNRKDPLAAENRRLSIVIVPPREMLPDMHDVVPDPRLFEPDKLDEQPINVPKPASAEPAAKPEPAAEPAPADKPEPADKPKPKRR
jgi:chemotaxis protein MotB